MPVKRQREEDYMDRTRSAQGVCERSIQNFYGASLRGDITCMTIGRGGFTVNITKLKLQGSSLGQAPSKALAVTLTMP